MRHVNSCSSVQVSPSPVTYGTCFYTHARGMCTKIKMSPTNGSSENLEAELNLEAIDRQLNKLGLTLTEDNPNETSEEGEGENVKVMLRCRPLIKSSEKDSCVSVNDDLSCVQLEGGRQFFFDQVFGPKCDNETIYMKTARRLLEFAFKGYNCTLFLYGQTGTGKTFTHSALTSSAFVHLFELIRDSSKHSNFLIRASYYELYNEEIRDLLANNSKALELRESKSRGVYVKDLSSFLVNNVDELAKLKRLGDKRRTTSATRMNEHSSRSHSIFSITIETVVLGDSDKTLAKDEIKRPQSSSNSVRLGRIHLIDLAGSERQAKSGSIGLKLKEASRINLSLTCLSLVIRSLTDAKSSHIPYRNSKLTRLLSNSLGGNSKTMLIACISPSRSNLSETLDTLRFASRTKRIRNKAVINEDAKDALLKKYRRQIEDLRQKLRDQQQLSNSSKADQIESQIIESLEHEPEIGTSKGQTSDQENLLSHLRLLRAKIMVGGENLLERAEMHQKLLDASKAELDEKRDREVRLKKELEEKHRTIEQVTKSKGTLEGQVVELNDKLRRSLNLYAKTKEDQQDLHSEHQLLKENLLHSIRATSKEIRYADCIIDDFIPRNFQDLINAYAQYDDDSDQWQIKFIALSGNNIVQTKRITEGRAKPSKNNKLDDDYNEASSRLDPYVRSDDLETGDDSS